MSITMFRCPNCDAQNPATSKFCMKCGQPLIPKQITQKIERPQNAPSSLPSDSKPSFASTNTSSEKSRRLRLFGATTLFGLADVVLLIAALALGVFTLIRPTTSFGCPTIKAPEDARVADSREVISDKLSGFVILRADQTYDFRGEVRVAEDATLQIESGARLLFDKGSRLVIDGLLHACGSRGNPIVFTSVRDGVTSGAGAEPGDWQGIIFEKESSDASILSNVQIRYAGQDRYPAIYLNQASPTLADLRITDSAWFPLSADPASEPSFAGSLELENVAVKGMEVRGGDLYDNVTWNGKNVVRMVSDHIIIKDGGKLTIKPGLVLKFADDKSMVVEGTLIAAGGGKGAPTPNSGKSIVFTSWRDDDVAGDSDLRTAEPKPGDWRGIVFQSSNRNTLLQNVVVRYAGRSGHAAVSLSESNPELKNMVIEHSDGYGLSSDAVSAPKIAKVNLQNNRLGSGWEIRGGHLSDRETYRWDDGGGLIRVISDNLMIDREATLVIQEGARIRFEIGKGLYVDGTLEIAGSEKQGIVFSSIRDDSEDAGGDVDGSDAVPTEGDWYGIRFSQTSNDKRSMVRFALIRYANSGLIFDAVSPVVENMTIEHSSGPPMDCLHNSQPTLTDIKLFENAESNTCAD